VKKGEDPVRRRHLEREGCDCGDSEEENGGERYGEDNGEVEGLLMFR
jgi:hypothetical protein